MIRRASSFNTERLDHLYQDPHQPDRQLILAGVDPDRHVRTDPRYYRPAEVDYLQGDPSKAGRVLGWKPTVDFEALVHMMVDHDLGLARQERTLAEAGHSLPLRGAASQ